MRRAIVFIVDDLKIWEGNFNKDLVAIMRIKDEVINVFFEYKVLADLRPEDSIICVNSNKYRCDVKRMLRALVSIQEILVFTHNTLIDTRDEEFSVEIDKEDVFEKRMEHLVNSGMDFVEFFNDCWALHTK